MLKLDSKDIKKKRTLKIFIEETRKLINEVGIDNVTIRKVAEKTGYNSATIYNYFDNCNQLIFFASLDFLGEYSQAMPAYIADAEDEKERFILMWECFCKFSFENPKIYYSIFTEHIGDESKVLMDNYFKIYPKKLQTADESLVPMLRSPDLSERASVASQALINNNLLSKETAKNMDNMITYIYHGLLTLMINKRTTHTAESALETITKHIRTIVNNAVCCKNINQS